MLLNSDAPKDLRMRMCPSAGQVPAAASEALVASGECIAAAPFWSRTLPVPNSQAWRAASAEVPVLISAPVRIDGCTVGVLNVTGVAFSEAELGLFEVIALFNSKSDK